MKKKKKVSLQSLIVMILITAIVIVGIIVAVINIKKSIFEKESANEAEQTVELAEGSLIDLNNTENAKIEEGKKINISEKAHEKKSYNEYEFTELNIDSTNSETNFNITVTNTSNSTTEEIFVNVICYNKDEQEIGKFILYIPKLEANASETECSITADDLINLYDYKIEKIELPE